MLLCVHRVLALCQRCNITGIIFYFASNLQDKNIKINVENIVSFRAISALQNELGALGKEHP